MPSQAVFRCSGPCANSLGTFWAVHRAPSLPETGQDAPTHFRHGGREELGRWFVELSALRRRFLQIFEAIR